MFLKKLFQKANKNIHVGKDAAKLLHNKYVLYGVAGVSFVNLLLLLIAGDIFHAVVFLLLGFLTSFFSKNMVVILAIALAATNLMKFGLDYAKEGMENGGEDVVEGAGESTYEIDQGETEEDIIEGVEQPPYEEDNEEEENTDGMTNTYNEDDNKSGVKNTTEGMTPLGYSSLVPNVLEDQATLFTNIGQLTPYVIKAENASIQATKMKYENFRSAK